MNFQHYKKLYAEAVADTDSFWAREAGRLHWHKKWRQVSQCQFHSPVSIKWFLDAKLNVSFNCVDRHAQAHPDRVALIWEPERPSSTRRTRHITYRQLHENVCRWANMLKAQGVKKGQVVTIYLPMIVDVVYAMLACARIGAPHSVVFAGFSASALQTRIRDCKSPYLITADVSHFKGQVLDLKTNADKAAHGCPELKKIFMVNNSSLGQRVGSGQTADLNQTAGSNQAAGSSQIAGLNQAASSSQNMSTVQNTGVAQSESIDQGTQVLQNSGFDQNTNTDQNSGTDQNTSAVQNTGSAGLSYINVRHELVQHSIDCPPEVMDSEDPLFILYTSGSTGQPKGVLHTSGGYLVYASYTHEKVFNYTPGQVYWCAADVGWITGHSYIVYGPLSNGATVVMFEGAPHQPPNRIWQVVEKHKVNILYTAPTLIRALMRYGDTPVHQHDLSSLQLLGTVGEPINPKAWWWYYNVPGRKQCPIVDTWWQTETGGVLISPLPGATPLQPGSATQPLMGIQPAVLDDKGHELQGSAEGRLCIKTSWPGQMRGLYNNQQLFEDTYFSQHKGYYFTGDGCRRDAEGNYWITGRMDDVLNVSGHRIGTAEVESALVSYPSVSEAAVVGFEHPVKGQGIYAFVSLSQGVSFSAALKDELLAHIAKQIGPIAKPDFIHYAPELPKTRSGKIMRRVLRKIAALRQKVAHDVVARATTIGNTKSSRMVEAVHAGGAADMAAVAAAHLPASNVDFKSIDWGDLSTLADPSVVENLVQDIG